MIHHYINLVCWRPMLELYDKDRDLVWVESVSLRSSLARLRPDAEFRPGFSILSQIGPGEPGGGNWYFFTAEPIAHLSAQNHMPLPFFDVVTLPEHIVSVLMALPAETRVGIGISSPKQNYLAAAMHALRPDLEYHCLGAAIAFNFAHSRVKNLVFSGSSFGWLKFLVYSPRRTLAKIATTLGETLAIRLHRPSRNDFSHFAQICMRVPERAENIN